jgi:hypothetical protein
MDKKGFSDLPGTYLAIFLILVALGSLFGFVINWEDWFFGIKLDGWLEPIRRWPTRMGDSRFF